MMDRFTVFIIGLLGAVVFIMAAHYSKMERQYQDSEERVNRLMEDKALLESENQSYERMKSYMIEEIQNLRWEITDIKNRTQHRKKKYEAIIRDINRLDNNSLDSTLSAHLDSLARTRFAE